MNEYEQDKSMIMQECNSDLEKQGCDEEMKEYLIQAKKKGKWLPSSQSMVPKTYPCSECPLVFEKAIDRFNHINTVHFPGKYFCIVCDMKFSYSHDLKSHNLIHQNGSGMFECEICGKLVSSATSLRDTRNFIYVWSMR